MAKLDIIFIGGYGSLAFNVTASVGRGGTNQVGDVVLIQAVFAFLAGAGEAASRGWYKLKVPAVDGNPNSGIKETIVQYQTLFARDLSGVSYDQRRGALEYPPGFENKDPLGTNTFLRADGLIHPANYKRRDIGQLWGRPLMTITKLSMRM